MRKDLYLIIENEYKIVSTISLESKLINYDSGLILAAIEEKIVLSDFSANTQITTEKYLENILKDF